MVYNRRILLIEDNNPELNQISLILEMNGYEVLRPETDRKVLKIITMEWLKEEQSRMKKGMGYVQKQEIFSHRHRQ